MSTKLNVHFIIANFLIKIDLKQFNIINQNQNKINQKIYNKANKNNSSLLKLFFQLLILENILKIFINLSLTVMQLINELLKNTSEDIRNNYKSHLRLHLKTIMTSINKSRLQDLTKVQIRKNKCILKCYESALNVLKPQQNADLKAKIADNQNQANENMIIAVDELKDCKKSCKKQQHAVRKHLDDINFYSKRKFVGCSSKCQKKYSQILEQQKSKGLSQNQLSNKNLSKPYNECMWDCYNRLDRRYKDYWKKQQDQVIQGYL